MHKPNLLKDFINKYHIFLPKAFTLSYIALLFLQHVCINLKDWLTVRKYCSESKSPQSQLEIWIRSNKTEDMESVPQSFTLETQKRVVCLYAVNYLTQPRNFSV